MGVGLWANHQEWGIGIKSISEERIVLFFQCVLCEIRTNLHTNLKIKKSLTKEDQKILPSTLTKLLYIILDSVYVHRQYRLST